MTSNIICVNKNVEIKLDLNKDIIQRIHIVYFIKERKFMC